MATASAKLVSGFKDTPESGGSTGGIAPSLPDKTTRPDQGQNDGSWTPGRSLTHTERKQVLTVNLFLDIFVVLLGLAFGSFLNVCIGRLPRHESIVHPPSHCPNCDTRILTRDNIPLLSYALLRGRCRNCRSRIFWRYPAVEFVTAALWLLCYLQFGLTVQGVGMAIFCFLALGLAVMDAETLLLLDAFTFPGILLGVVYSALSAGKAFLIAVGWSILWAAAAASLILAINGMYWLIRRRPGIGLGDAKLFAMIAAWLGPRNAVLAFFLAVVFAAIYGILRIARDRQWQPTVRLPLGAFLAAAALYTVFAGTQTIAWYLHFFP
jgi:leader peptidase (prepilin peptidase) / N-methyltransferase